MCRTFCWRILDLRANWNVSTATLYVSRPFALWCSCSRFFGDAHTGYQANFHPRIPYLTITERFLSYAHYRFAFFQRFDTIRVRLRHLWLLRHFDILFRDCCNVGHGLEELQVDSFKLMDFHEFLQSNPQQWSRRVKRSGWGVLSLCYFHVWFLSVGNRLWPRG